ncbi:MAG: sulfatase [Planctomycetes bacterium]|nr:sulfatase [Planctomycetota bacterium]
MLSLPRSLALTALAALAGACGGAPAAGPPNVLLVVLDTTRAADLGCYGGARGLTPRLDALAAEGLRFAHASAHAPWTLPSTASLFTSRLPEEHGAGGALDLGPLRRGGQPSVDFHALAPEVDTLAEAFAAAGWRTAAVVNVDFLDRPFGLTQGFEHVDAAWSASNDEVRDARGTTDAALAWLDGARGAAPFFLLVHYFDPHAVYAPPAEYRRRFAAPQDRGPQGLVFGTREQMLLLRAGRLELDPALVARAKGLYDGELAYLDAQVGRLLDGLAARGLERDTLVVVTADHGEEFREHGGFEHGHTLYEELLHVPLLVRFPGRVPAGAVRSDRVGLIDVAPTVCALAGVAAPAGFRGHDLLARDFAPRPLLAHGNFWGPALSSWTSGRWKLVLVPEADGAERAELYDLEADPGEARDLAATEPARAAELRAELDAARALLRARARGEAVELSPDERRRLEALGYLGAGDDAR